MQSKGLTGRVKCTYTKIGTDSEFVRNLELLFETHRADLNTCNLTSDLESGIRHDLDTLYTYHDLQCRWQNIFSFEFRLLCIQSMSGIE